MHVFTLYSEMLAYNAKKSCHWSLTVTKFVLLYVCVHESFWLSWSCGVKQHTGVVCIFYIEFCPCSSGVYNGYEIHRCVREWNRTKLYTGWSDFKQLVKYCMNCWIKKKGKFLQLSVFMAHMGNEVCKTFKKHIGCKVQALNLNM